MQSAYTYVNSVASRVSSYDVRSLYEVSLKVPLHDFLQHLSSVSYIAF
jgi:hypothetical protein